LWVMGFATQCRRHGGAFVSREKAGNEWAGASAAMAGAWADSFPAPSDTPILPWLPKVDPVAKPG
jgi:hypothetical protein